MVVKSAAPRNYWRGKINAFLRKNRRNLMLVFVTYTLLLLSAGLVFFYNKVPYEIRQKVLDRFSVTEIPVNFLKGITARPERFFIHVKHKDWQKLAYIRQMSLQKENLYDTEDNSVPAVIRIGNQSYRVELGLKGLLRAHWENEDMMSLKVNVKDNKTIMGMKRFALQHPKARGYAAEWLLHQFFAEEGIIHLRYDFISVEINGKPSHIFALEERFEERLIGYNRRKDGPILEFDSNFSNPDRNSWNEGSIIGIPQDMWASRVAPMPQNKTLADTSMARLFDKGKSLMEAFRQNKLRASEVFDVDQLALYFALVEIFGGHHASNLDNVRFYYNPVTSRIEPIIHDNDHLYRLEDYGLLGEERQLGEHIQYSAYGGWWKRTAWYESVFKDHIFYRAYIQALQKIAADGYLESFIERNRDELLKKQKILYRDYYIYDLDPVPQMLENRDYISKVLKINRLLDGTFASFHGPQKTIQLQITNRTNLPIEILGASLGDSILLEPLESHKIIQANIQATPAEVATIGFRLPERVEFSESLLAALTLHSQILGSDKPVRDPVSTTPILGDIAPLQASKHAALNEFSFLAIDEPARRIFIELGSHDLDKDLVIPGGYRVFARAGTRIDLRNGASIFSSSPVFLLGSELEPIIFYSSDSTGLGIVMMNVEEESNLQHVHFENLAQPLQSETSVSAAITFYRSPVFIDNCFFGNNRQGDCLRIVHADFAISRSTFFQSSANAFGTDFSEGSLTECRFIDSGKDAINVSYSQITLENILVDQARNRGLNVRQKSSATGTKVRIRQSVTGVSSSDMSKVWLDDISLTDCQVAFAAFQQKKQFGPAEIVLLQKANLSGGIAIPNLLDERSKLIIAGKPIKVTKNPDRLKIYLEE